MSLFITVPNELIQNIIVFLHNYNTCEHFEAYIKQVVPSYTTNWEYIFAMRLPNFYQRIKKLQKIDHRLNTLKYTNPFAWRMYYADISNLMLDTKNIKHLHQFRLYPANTNINIINIETVNMVRAACIHDKLNHYKNGRKLYKYSLTLPDTPVTHGLFLKAIEHNTYNYDEIFEGSFSANGLDPLYLYLKYVKKEGSVELNTKEVFLLLREGICWDADKFNFYENEYYYYSIIKDILLFLFNRLFIKSITYDDLIKHKYVKQMIANLKVELPDIKLIIKDTVMIFNKS